MIIYDERLDSPPLVKLKGEIVKVQKYRSNAFRDEYRTILLSTGYVIHLTTEETEMIINAKEEAD